MFCLKCGDQYEEGAVFCKKCGELLSKQQDSSDQSLSEDLTDDNNQTLPEDQQYSIWNSTEDHKDSSDQSSTEDNKDSSDQSSIEDNIDSSGTSSEDQLGSSGTSIKNYQDDSQQRYKPPINSDYRRDPAYIDDTLTKNAQIGFGLSILSILCCCSPFANIPLGYGGYMFLLLFNLAIGIAAVALCSKGLNSSLRGLSIAGMVIGIIGLLFTSIGIFGCMSV